MEPAIGYTFSLSHAGEKELLTKFLVREDLCIIHLITIPNVFHRRILTALKCVKKHLRSSLSNEPCNTHTQYCIVDSKVVLRCTKNSFHTALSHFLFKDCIRTPSHPGKTIRKWLGVVCMRAARTVQRKFIVKNYENTWVEGKL